MSQQTVLKTQELDESTSSQVVSRVNLIVSLVSAKPEQMNAIYGRSLPDSFAELDQGGSWRKTSQGYSQVTMDGSLEEFSETWPDWGMSLDGRAIELPMSALSIPENERLLWPTLTASEWKGVPKNRFYGSPTYRSDKLASRFRKQKDDMTHLNPGYAELFMGFPMGWTELKPLETP